MCDYSLHLVASRPAKVGDKLVTTAFNNSLTRGFASVGEPQVAVCLLPGTEVRDRYQADSAPKQQLRQEINGEPEPDAILPTAK